MTAVIEDSGEHRLLPDWQTEPCAPWCNSIHDNADAPEDRHCLSEQTRVITTHHTLQVLAPSGTREVHDEVRTCIEAAPDCSPTVVLSTGDHHRTLTPDEALRAGMHLVADALRALGTVAP